MTLEQLMAFTITDNVRQQEKIWRELPQWGKERGEADTIRDQITEKHIDASTNALANATLPYVLALADRGVLGAIAADPGLRLGVNVAAGVPTHPAVARAV